jgi:2-dehydropantoate 2-reductase
LPYSHSMSIGPRWIDQSSVSCITTPRLQSLSARSVRNSCLPTDAVTLGIADVVLFAVKLHQVEEAAHAAAPLFGSGTLGISLLNGIEGLAMIARILPGTTILGGSAYVSALVAAPGHIRYTGDMSRIVYGMPGGDDVRARDKAAEFADRCRRAGIGAEMTKDVDVALWTKMVGLAANAALTSAARLPAGLLYGDSDVLEVASALIAETAAGARAAGVALPADVEARNLALLKSLPYNMYASMYHDLARGNPLEIDGFSGFVVRQGKRLGVPTPHHAALYAVLKPHRAGAPKSPC